jgi:hypothetical protein
MNWGRICILGICLLTACASQSRKPDLSTINMPSIKRVDRNRAINVTADVDEARGNANEINLALTQEVLPEVLRRHPGVRYT